MSVEQIELLLDSEDIGYEREFKFHDKRKWRADFIIAGYPLLVEYEGIKGKSRHTTITGYSNDCEKYNQAQIIGYTVLRYTVIHLKNPQQIIDDIKEFMRRYEN